MRCAARSRCSAAWLSAMRVLPAERRIEFRIGINVGDIIVEDGDIFGDGVNVAARLEGAGRTGRHLRLRARAGAMPSASSMSPSRTRASSSSRTSPARCRSIACGSMRSQRDTSLARVALPDKPSIAVLPFQNMSGDPEQEYFADGIVEDIITALSRFRWLFVIARNSTFTYKGQAVECEAGRARAGRALRARRRPGRPCAGAQPELRPRLVCEQHSQDHGRLNTMSQ